MRSTLATAAGTMVAVLLLGTIRGQAHKPITSKYMYNEDVFPILRDRCGKCHVTGGVAPMSLMTYKDAVPWAESIRAELLAAHMPPWYADEGYGQFKNVHTLSSRELDVLIVWASGGTPQGDPTKKLPPVALNTTWRMGLPDLLLPMSSAFTLPADALEDTREFVLPTHLTADRWVRGADLLPGTPAMVHDAVISVGAAEESGVARAAPSADAVLAMWLPGGDPDRAAAGAGFKLRAGADIRLRIHYRKTWKYEGKPLTDLSTVGLYFLDHPPNHELQRLTMTAPSPAGQTSVTATHTVDTDLQAMAFGSDIDVPNVGLRVRAVRPDGVGLPLIRLRTRPHWSRRYWFDAPVSLPRGTRIELTATLERPDQNPLTGEETTPPAPGAARRDEGRNAPLRVWIDLVPASRPAGSRARQPPSGVPRE